VDEDGIFAGRDDYCIVIRRIDQHPALVGLALGPVLDAAGDVQALEGGSHATRQLALVQRLSGAWAIGAQVRPGLSGFAGDPGRLRFLPDLGQLIHHGTLDPAVAHEDRERRIQNGGARRDLIHATAEDVGELQGAVLVWSSADSAGLVGATQGHYSQ
jgi:hypothetical protein